MFLTTPNRTSHRSTGHPYILLVHTNSHYVSLSPIRSQGNEEINTLFLPKMDASPGSARPDRKTIEKKRRMQMKSLYKRLNSLLPCSKEGTVSLPLPELLDESVSYIKDLQRKVEHMKETKSRLAGGSMGVEISTITPHLDLREVDGRVGAAIITDARDWSVFCKVVEVIEEEGGEIMSANVTIVGNKAFYIIHCLVEEDNGGSETMRVSEKLRNRVKSIVGCGPAAITAV